MKEFAAALCLVLVIEGLFLFAATDAWKRTMEQMRQVDARALRMIGGAMVAIGLVALRLVH